MRIKYLVILIVSVLILNGCGVKGPVKPIKKKSADTVQKDSVQQDEDIEKKPGSCAK